MMILHARHAGQGVPMKKGVHRVWVLKCRAEKTLSVCLGYFLSSNCKLFFLGFGVPEVAGKSLNYVTFTR